MGDSGPRFGTAKEDRTFIGSFGDAGWRWEAESRSAPSRNSNRVGSLKTGFREGFPVVFLHSKQRLFLLTLGSSSGIVTRRDRIPSRFGGADGGCSNSYRGIRHTVLKLGALPGLLRRRRQDTPHLLQAINKQLTSRYARGVPNAGSAGAPPDEDPRLRPFPGKARRKTPVGVPHESA